MIVVNNVRIPIKYDHNTIINNIAKRVKYSDILEYKIIKKSVDARKELCYVMNFLVKVKNDNKYPDLIYKEKKKLIIGEYKGERPVIIGAGPAGLFAGLVLAYAKAKPLIIERGKPIDERDKDVANFLENRVFDENSNMVFGLGGAGSYSDGKLTTNINNDYIRFILEEMVKFGAPEEILFEAKPHIGTDILKKVVSNIADKIISLGGSIQYSSLFLDYVGDQKIEGIKILQKGKEEIIKTNAVILAVGHSARETFLSLSKHHVLMEQKPFSIGVRIEHKQKWVDERQYGKNSPIGKAEYKIAVHLKDRDVYTFCMCPGGFVVPSNNEEGSIVTNGMSYHQRDNENANAALLVNVKTSDFASNDPLAGFAFQEKYEKLAFQLAGNYKAPVMRVEDFLNDLEPKRIGEVVPSYLMGYTLADLKKCLPRFAVAALKEGIKAIDRKMPGFSQPDAILTGVETRSSSPVRIVRNDMFMANIFGLYPCGEGAGYAGGITTSALDGIKIALELIENCF